MFLLTKKPVYRPHTNECMYIFRKNYLPGKVNVKDTKHTIISPRDDRQNMIIIQKIV